MGLLVGGIAATPLKRCMCSVRGDCHASFGASLTDSLALTKDTATRRWCRVEDCRVLGWRRIKKVVRCLLCGYLLVSWLGSRI